MAHIVYTAKRSVTDSHSIDTEYEFEIALNKFERSAKREQETAPSLAGVRFTVLHRIDVFYDVSTIPIKDTDAIDQMREFLDSVAGGEEFSIDVFGTIATADSPKILMIDGDYSETMVDVSGFYTFQFKALEI